MVLVLLMSEHELPLEASLRRTGASLRRFYRGRGSLGHLWASVVSAAPDAPVWSVLSRLEEEAAEAERAQGVDDALAMVDPKWRERDTLNRQAREAELAAAREEGT